MATGVLASTGISVADTDQLIYQVPAGYNAVVTVHIQNLHAANPATVGLAITLGGTPQVYSFIETGVTLAAAQGLERSGIVLTAGQRLYAKGSTLDIGVNVWGIEEAV